MTTEYVTAVVVVVPVILFAVGAEARAFEVRTRDQRGAFFWGSRIKQVLDHLREIPAPDPAWTTEQTAEWRQEVGDELERVFSLQYSREELFSSAKALALWLVGSVWVLTVFVLVLVEGLSLAWLGSEHRDTNGGLAVFSLVSILAGSGMLLVGPVLRLGWLDLLRPSVVLSLFRELYRLKGPAKKDAQRVGE
ncbi:hypothetical protein ACFQ0M_48670 [Kitasatospora aburaviensis]|uniref:Uncharacterized protein n=1 Tax=Kitasatospora aburaviensis TaxID=67265 RepID=A0ABW1F499_9ACTN